MAPTIADVRMRGNESEEEDGEEYDENADEDFDPDDAGGEEDQSSSSEEEPEQPAGGRKAKRGSKKRAAPEVTEEGLDSGDEATIQEQSRKRRKKDTQEDDDSAVERGHIRTRAQRLVEKVERKARRRETAGDVTIDVEQVWAQLNSIPIGRTTIESLEPSVDTEDVDGEQNKENADLLGADEVITIKRRIEYAGEVTEVEETVPKDSKEAQRYLAEHPELDPDRKPQEADSSGLQRPLKRPSIFEPNPHGLVRGVPPEKLRYRTPSRLDVLMAEKRAEEARKKKAEKMSTVQKSALDWKGFVDQEGLKAELDEYGKSKQGFLGREAFLDRAAGARQQAARDARLKL